MDYHIKIEKNIWNIILMNLIQNRFKFFAIYPTQLTRHYIVLVSCILLVDK